jgi:hypothetical protein
MSWQILMIQGDFFTISRPPMTALSLIVFGFQTNGRSISSTSHCQILISLTSFASHYEFHTRCQCCQRSATPMHKRGKEL